MDILFSSETKQADFWLPLLQKALPHDRIFTDFRNKIDVAVIASPPAGTLSRLQGVRLIQSLWMGVEKLLADPGYPKGVPLARLIDPGMVAAMTETVIAHVLDWHRHHYYYRSLQAEPRWRRVRQFLASDRTVGILGLGELGSDAARRLLDLGFSVAGFSRRSKVLKNVRSYTNLQEMLPSVDALVCLLPLTAQTKGILNAKTFAAMKPKGCVINLARGGHLVEKDLIAALDSGHLRQAYLDVFDTEPLPAAHLFWRHPGITITPHAAALTEPRTAIAKVVENIERVRRGETPLNLVDFSAGY
ncbi:MAG TPA: glyoxylate/hydroxypyruvate reductase A [Burkholderiales bacterium]